MLLQVESLPRKPISVQTGNETNCRLLQTLLAEWRYEIVSELTPKGLLLTEEGSPVSALRLSSPSTGRTESIALPLSVEILARTLSAFFHRQPRQHLRIQLSLPFTLKRGQEKEDGFLVSLSDRGCRFRSGRDLARGEEVELFGRLGEGEWHLRGWVIYVVPHGESTGPGSDIGVVFEALPPEHRRKLREFIVATYLRRVREKMNLEMFRAGLALVDLSPGLKRQLLQP
ncbi:MAG: PilZ domain-containing protein [Desulfuromonadales bacterium]